MAAESPAQHSETHSNGSLEQQDRMKLSVLHGLKTLIFQMTQSVLTVILTVIYTFQLFVNAPVEAPVPPKTSKLEDTVTVLTRRVYLEATNSTPALSPVSTNPQIKSEINLESSEEPLAEPPKSFKMPTATVSGTSYPGGIKAYYQAKIEAAELTINERTQNLRRLEAQRNALNARGKFGSLVISLEVSNEAVKLYNLSETTEGGTTASYGTWKLCRGSCKGYGQNESSRQGSTRGQI
jgi:hypothetical protein